MYIYIYIYILYKRTMRGRALFPALPHPISLPKDNSDPNDDDAYDDASNAIG